MKNFHVLYGGVWKADFKTRKQAEAYIKKQKPSEWWHIVDVSKASKGYKI
jgi:hypothetical protein